MKNFFYTFQNEQLFFKEDHLYIKFDKKKKNHVYKKIKLKIYKKTEKIVLIKRLNRIYITYNISDSGEKKKKIKQKNEKKIFFTHFKTSNCSSKKTICTSSFNITI